ncbi:MAG: hypothetical protein QOJ81_1746 [Chloroflexota bacterium]|jgi:hypothetical protein|nr:hypothetical protein [Chloroflexota bacterium]
MTAIWRNDGSGWRILPPAGFPDEAALHGLVEEAPHLLPLAGAPKLAVVGREVRLGTGFADLVAVETSGRLCVIEVKLQRNPEARRAVVAQVLTYAAYLRGLSREALEADILGAYLAAHQWTAIDDALLSVVQDGSHDSVVFDAGLRASLADGRFRLVLVLDDAPPELVRLVGYLEEVAGFTIDLVTVSPYEVGAERLLVPQRVDSERITEPEPPAPAGSRPRGRYVWGTGDYEAYVETLTPDRAAPARRMLEWVKGLETRGWARSRTLISPKGPATLLPCVAGEDVGLVTVWSGDLWFWRSVFDRRAPLSIARVEAAIAPLPLTQARVVKTPGDDVLAAVTAAYEEAASGG